MGLPVYKKGDSIDPNNDREINLLNHATKFTQTYYVRNYVDIQKLF